MALYGGIDLHSTNSWVALLDQDRKLVQQSKLPNDLGGILGFLEPYREELVGLAVESTFNWYWLVDGLTAAGYRVHLANTWSCQQYDGLKYTDDRHDARWLAHLLSLGLLREGYIYPPAARAVRDLLRRRAFLVRKRTALLLSMRGAFECRTGQRPRSDDLKRWTGAEVTAAIDDPLVALHITCLIEPLAALSEQIVRLEQEALRQGRLREEFRLLQTVWGIGRVLGLTIMYEVGEIGRFAKVGNFASYCRCVQSKRLSNDKRKGSGNRRNGNPYLSWAFSEAAHFAVRHHPPARRYFQKKRARSNGIIAIRALAHKLARASYHVLRDQVAFAPEKLFA
jgi:transposase